MYILFSHYKGAAEPFETENKRRTVIDEAHIIIGDPTVIIIIIPTGLAVANSTLTDIDFNIIHGRRIIYIFFFAVSYFVFGRPPSAARTRTAERARNSLPYHLPGVETLKVVIKSLH